MATQSTCSNPTLVVRLLASKPSLQQLSDSSTATAQPAVANNSNRPERIAIEAQSQNGRPSKSSPTGTTVTPDADQPSNNPVAGSAAGDPSAFWQPTPTPSFRVITDPMHHTAATPPDWEGKMGALRPDTELRHGHILSPVRMVGLPFGTLIEMAEYYGRD